MPPEVLAGRAAPGPELMGSRADLPEAVRSKMESSFGADFSGVQLYESQAVADAGAQAVTMGNRIAFAPGELDFSSTAGQALLGHELSHVVSQARGEVSGAGFLNDHALEALLDVAEGDDVTYIDFIEIRSAIERLGSEAPVRDFSNDPTYKAVKRLQLK